MQASNHQSNVRNWLSLAKQGKYPLERKNSGRFDYVEEIVALLKDRGTQVQVLEATDSEKTHRRFYQKLDRELGQVVRKEKSAVLDRLRKLAALQRRHRLSDDFIRGLFLAADEPQMAIDAIQHHTNARK